MTASLRRTRRHKQAATDRARLRDVAFAFVGSVTPDAPEFHNNAFSRAGLMFQQELLQGVQRAGLSPSRVLSVFPIPSFPHSKRVWVAAEPAMLPGEITVTFLPFVNITPLKQLTISLAALGMLVRWAWSVRDKRHRVICSYNLTIPSGWFTWLAARLTGSKFIACLNDINVPGQTVPSTAYTRLDFWLQRALIPRLDGHIAVADRIMQDFAPGKRYLRLEGGITAEVLRQADPDAAASRQEAATFTIVSVGLLNEANGIHLLLEAFGRLPGDRFRLRIAGEGPLAHAVREAAAHDPRIEYCGFLSFPQVLALYRTADALVNMRLTRSINTLYFFPSKMMEYLASGVPVITTCPAHVAEEFSDLAYLLEEETSEALRLCILQLAEMGPAARRARGAKARQYMAAHKTWDVQGRKFAGYVRETVLSGNAQGA